jgi:hypothetical protein
MEETSDGVPDGLDAGTIDVIYDHTAGAVPRQIATSHELDSKAIQVLAAAAVVIGLGATGLHHHHLVAIILYAAAVLAFIIAGHAAHELLWTRDFSVVDEPGAWMEVYWPHPPAAVKHALIKRAAIAYEENVVLLRDKHASLRRLITFSGIAGAFVGGALLSSLL